MEFLDVVLLVAGVFLVLSVLYFGFCAIRHLCVVWFYDSSRVVRQWVQLQWLNRALTYYEAHLDLTLCVVFKSTIPPCLSLFGWFDEPSGLSRRVLYDGICFRRALFEEECCPAICRAHKVGRSYRFWWRMDAVGREARRCALRWLQHRVLHGLNE